MGFEFGGFRLDSARRRLFAPDGAAVELPSRAFDVLLYMVERPGQLLDKSAILKAVWPSTVVEEGNLSQCIFAVRRALGDSGNDHRFIATIPGRGYQFIASVQPIVPAESAASTGAVAVTASAPRRGAAGYWIGGGALVAVLALVGYLVWVGAQRGVPQRAQATANAPSGAQTSLKSIAVMPFVDLSADRNMEYFGDGITEEIMNSLARITSLRMVGRRSTFAYKGKDDDARSIGERLKVDSILEGSVRKAGDRIRITAQLVRTRDGFSLWSQTFDRKLDDVLDVQEAIAREVVSSLSPVVGSPGATASSVPATRNADAYNAYLRGKYLFGRGTDVDYPRARDEFLRATELDPDFALAHAWLGRVQSLMARRGLGDVARNRALGDASLERALKLDAQLADLWWVRGAWPTNVDNLSFALRANYLERALANDRSDPAPMIQLAFLYNLMGRRDDVLKLYQQAYEADPLWPNTLINAAATNYAFGDRAFGERLLNELEAIAPNDPRAANHRAMMAFAEGRALDWDRWKARAIEKAPRDQPLHGYLSLDYGNLGLLDAALYHARMCRTLNPESAASDYNVAHIHLYAGNIEAARPVVKRVMEEKPGDYLAQLAQANFQYFTGNCDGALRLIELARPAFRQPVASLNLFTDRQDIPTLVWCLRQQGNTARAREVAQAFKVLYVGGNLGTNSGLKARVAAAAGDRDTLVENLRELDDTRSMDFGFVRHEPMIQPYLKDNEVTRLLDSIDARRAEWRRIIPKSSMRVPIPDAPKNAGS